MPSQRAAVPELAENLLGAWPAHPPPDNVRLDMRMPHLLADSLKDPSDDVPS